MKNSDFQSSNTPMSPGFNVACCSALFRICHLLIRLLQMFIVYIEIFASIFQKFSHCYFNMANTSYLLYNLQLEAAYIPLLCCCMNSLFVNYFHIFNTQQKTTKQNKIFGFDPQTKFSHLATVWYLQKIRKQFRVFSFNLRHWCGEKIFLFSCQWPNAS